MKKTLVLIPLLLLPGCAFHRTTDHIYNPESKAYDRTVFTGIVWFNRQAVKGLQVGKRTKTTSTTLSISEAATETQAEAIKAAAEGAVTGALKVSNPIP